MVDEIDKAFVDAISAQSGISHYVCRDCGLEFEKGRDGRQHMFSEHDSPNGLMRVKNE